MLLIKPTDIDIEVWNGPFGKICNELMKRKDDMHVDLWDDSINEATYMDIVSKSLQTKKYIDDGYIGSSRLIDYNNEYTYYMMFISITKGDNYKLNHIGSMFNPSINSVYENIILLKIDINKQIVHMNFEEIMPLIEKKRLHKCVYIDENDNKQELTINNAWVVDGKGNENIY